MIRTTISIDDELSAEIDSYIARAKVLNRSEAIRDLVRRGLNALPDAESSAPCIGVISCSVDQTMPGLSKRLREARMFRHHEIIFTASVPVNHKETIDISVVRGSAGRVSDHAKAMFMERGVKHGAVALTPVQEETLHHSHEDEEPHSHSHFRVQETF